MAVARIGTETKLCALSNGGQHLFFCVRVLDMFCVSSGAVTQRSGVLIFFVLSKFKIRQKKRKKLAVASIISFCSRLLKAAVTMNLQSAYKAEFQIIQSVVLTADVFSFFNKILAQTMWLCTPDTR